MGFCLKKFKKAFAAFTAVTLPGPSANIAAMYSKPVRRLFLKHEWARTLGSAAANFYGGPIGSAAFSAYLTDISGGSPRDIRKAFGTSLAMSFIMSGGKMNVTPTSVVNSEMKFMEYLYKSSRDKAMMNYFGRNTDINKLNLGLLALSYTGDYLSQKGILEDSNREYLVTDPCSEGEFMVEKFNMGFFGKGAWGVPFDIVDTILEYQGIMSASNARFAKMITPFDIANGRIRGHSLGALRVNNLEYYGLAKNTQVDALPFFAVGVAGTVNIGSNDLVNGLFLGKLLTPGANIIDQSSNDSFVHGSIPGYGYQY